MIRLWPESSLLSSGFKRTVDFIFFIARRLYRDHCAQIAASLTYTSLLAFVPLLIIGFAILKEFAIFPELINSQQSVILQIFTPDVGEDVKLYIQDVVNKGTKLPVLSFLILIFTAVMMLYTIDDTLNRIWRVGDKRRTLFSFAVYFVVVLSGPLLLGGSLAGTTYLLSHSLAMDDSTRGNWLVSVPWLVTFLAFTSLYRWVPNTHVRWKYALSGGLVAMLLFELAKWGFALYIRWVPTYGLLYGALAAIPLTLVWVYLSWLVVLVGAETAHCLAIYTDDEQESNITAGQLLSFFFRAGEEGASLEQIAAWGYLSKYKLRRILAKLQQLGLVQELVDRRYGLSDKATSMSLAELNLELTKQLKRVKR